MHKLLGALMASSCNGIDTMLLDCGEAGGISAIIKMVLNFLFGGVVTVATIGLIAVGVRYLSARDNEQQIAQAKRRALQIIIGLATATMLWVLVPLALPGMSEGGIDGTLSELDEKSQFTGNTKAEPLTTPSSDTTNSTNSNSSNASNSNNGTAETTDGNIATSVDDAVWNNGNECSGEKIFPGKKYNLTEKEKGYFSELVARENCRGKKTGDETFTLGCRLLATQIINLYEEREYNRKGVEGCSGGACFYKNLKKWVTSDKWYAANKSSNNGLRPGKYSNINSDEAVEYVIVNGNRVLPKFVTRYDGLYHWTEGRSGFKGLRTISEAAAAVPMQTVVKGKSRYLWCIERKDTSKKANGPYNEVFNYEDSYRKALGM